MKQWWVDNPGLSEIEHCNAEAIMVTLDGKGCRGLTAKDGTGWMSD
jgi:hypothetical protein